MTRRDFFALSLTPIVAPLLPMLPSRSGDSIKVRVAPRFTVKHPGNICAVIGCSMPPMEGFTVCKFHGALALTPPMWEMIE